VLPTRAPPPPKKSRNIHRHHPLTVAAFLVGSACSSPCASPTSPGMTVKTAVEIGTLQASPLIVGRDGAYTALLWGHEVWTFGDTFLSVANVQGTSFVSNTFSVSDTTVTDGGVVLADRLDDAGAPDELLFPTADEEAYDLAHQSQPDGGCGQTPCGGRWATWPGPTVFDADAGTALTFYSLLTAAPGNFNFSSVGESLAVWTDFSSLPSRPEPNVCSNSPTLLFCNSDPPFGNAAALSNGDIYAFACARSVLRFPCQLGRVPFAGALTKSAWEYWDGQGWTPDVSKSTALFDGAPIMGLSFNEYAGVWMLIYAEPLSDQVVVRTAQDITGPWSATGNLFTADRKGTGGNTYDALPHPELAEQTGRVQYVTFSRSNGTFFGSEFALVRVTFE
jgi:hypothetical protein